MIGFILGNLCGFVVGMGLIYLVIGVYLPRCFKG